MCLMALLVVFGIIASKDYHPIFSDAPVEPVATFKIPSQFSWAVPIVIVIVVTFFVAKKGIAEYDKKRLEKNRYVKDVRDEELTSEYLPKIAVAMKEMLSRFVQSEEEQFLKVSDEMEQKIDAVIECLIGRFVDTPEGYAESNEWFLSKRISYGAQRDIVKDCFAEFDKAEDIISAFEERLREKMEAMRVEGMNDEEILEVI